MDQGKWEEIMEFLKVNQQKMDANQEGMMARMDADKAEAKREREADKAESMANQLDPTSDTSCRAYAWRLL
jgi:hypothetical protein